MNINLPKLKELAQAAQQNQYDPVVLNDYGMAVPPATVLELIAEIERHRQVEAEGCKPEISNRHVGGHTSDAPPMRDLDKAEGGKPDSSITPTPKALSEVKAADNALFMAQVGLLATVRRVYPMGSRLMIHAGRNKIEVEVTGHCAAWWSRPGFIFGKNLKTNKPRTFHHSNVVEVLP